MGSYIPKYYGVFREYVYRNIKQIITKLFHCLYLKISYNILEKRSPPRGARRGYNAVAAVSHGNPILPGERGGARTFWTLSR